MLNFAVSVLLLAILFGAIYKVLPDRTLQWTDVVTGALITSVLFNIGKSLIAWYIGSSAVASSYGAAGGLIVLLLWVITPLKYSYSEPNLQKSNANRHGSKQRKPSLVVKRTLRGERPYRGIAVANADPIKSRS
jgi:Predicted membrane protein